MVGWHHWLNGHEFEQTLGDGEGQESLVCCSSWGCKEPDMPCCFSVAQSCLMLCDPKACSMLGFPVLHCLLELAQTHVHRVSDAIQPSHPRSSPSPPAFSPSIRVFSSESALRIRCPKYWSFSFSPSNEHSELISFRIDWFDLLAV